MNHVYLTVDQVLIIHHDQINESGGSHGVMNAGALESALARPRSGYYADIFEEAAALLESLTNNHPFYDGNKRVAFVATAAFLELNGFRITCNPTAANRFIRGITTKKQDRFTRIVDWITRHSHPVNSQPTPLHPTA